MTPNEQNTPRSTDTGCVTHKTDLPNNSPIQINYIRRYYGLNVAQASMIAALAWGASK
ncbi:hypothetical protein C8N31_101481 [Sulfitobacter mediterraneus]|uniref:Uncharacterized protein n=1 Tax=Sulfitobacter mediterraneus TaxID=83219 RepID=A0A2T6CJY3_9RHOB|nr:hypothetical protein C8N31_101481 [Sulfitobacter mediterraneus]